MIVTTTLKFRARREPFPYDMTSENGPKGVSYSFDAIDEDDTKVKIKCTEDQWNALGNVARDTPIKVRLKVQSPRVDGPDGLSLPAPRTAAA